MQLNPGQYVQGFLFVLLSPKETKNLLHSEVGDWKSEFEKNFGKGIILVKFGLICYNILVENLSLIKVKIFLNRQKSL